MSVAHGAVIGIDYGSRRIGVAATDPMRILASGAGTFENAATFFEALKQIVTERSAVLIVVGMPYSADGGKGEKAREVDRFIVALRDQIPLPVATWDESNSSVEARRAMAGSGMKRKKRQEKGRVDEMAARLLLQEFVDAGCPGGA